MPVPVKTSNIKLGGDRPFPFIFCSKNWALKRYGGKTTSLGGTSSIINASYPVDNLIDGNRSSFCQIEKLGRMTTLNYMKLRFDLSGTDFPSDIYNQIDFICIENDPYFPAREFHIRSFTDSAYSANVYTHKIFQPNYIVAAGKMHYRYGAFPRIDATYLYGGAVYDSSKQAHDGFDGRFCFIPLEEPIPYDRSFIEIIVKGPGRNIVGYDGTFSDGLWSGAIDEVLETTDPAGTGNGSNNNHIRLYTDNVTHNSAQLSKSINFSIRKGDKFIFKWWEKAASFFNSSDGYRITISYKSATGVDLLTDVLYKSIGGTTSWTHRTAFINFIDNDGIRKAGTTEGANYYHNVPEDAVFCTIRFELSYNSSFLLSWKIDDVTVYNAENIPCRLSEVESKAISSVYQSLPIYNDQSGIVKIRSIGIYSFKFATSLSKNYPANYQDLSGRASANPSTIIDSSDGRVLVRDMNNQIIGQFVPRSGTKRSREITVFGTSSFKNFLADLEVSTYPFGFIDIQGDFGDYVIEPGSLRWSDEPASKQEVYIYPVYNATTYFKKFSEQTRFRWSGTLTLKEA